MLLLIQSSLSFHIKKQLLGGGYLSHCSLYGKNFHVKSVPGAINIAYTSAYLCPHQDLPYYESKPGLQLLHCVALNKDIIQGGESLLIDAMAAAHEFRQLTPEYFKTLTTCNCTFVKQREGASIAYTRPIIQLATRHESSRQNEEIVAVHWAPPFEGPLTIDPELLIPYFEAYSAFELMVDKTIDPIQRSIDSGINRDLAIKLSKYANDYTWEYTLNPGEMIIFNNTRMLHGRNEFYLVETQKKEDTTSNENDCTSEENNGMNSHLQEARHLVGAYTNIDDSLNCYRIMLQKKKMNTQVPNVGNGTGVVLPPNNF